MKKALTAIGLGLALTLTGCGDPGVDGSVDGEGVEFETEDCDREDALRGERECTSAQIKKARAATAKPKAPSPAKAPATKPRTTTRKKK